MDEEVSFGLKISAASFGGGFALISPFDSQKAARSVTAFAPEPSSAKIAKPQGKKIEKLH